MQRESVLKDAQILIVDDIQENIKVLGNTLYRYGVRLSIATNGKQALKNVEKLRPELILLDVTMPEMDGFTVCQELKANPEFADIPVVFLTARADSEDVVRGFEVGGVDYITKPFNQLELISRVCTHLELSRSKKELDEQAILLIKKDKERDKFLSLISHDLRSPFGGILGLMELIEQDFNEMSTNEIKDYISSIKKALNNQYAFLEHLLEWGNIQIGRRAAVFDIIPLGDQVQKKIEQLELTAKQKGISIVSRIEDEVKIYADVNMFNTILHNLIGNSIKFSHTGGLIEIYNEPNTDAGFVNVCVKDNGVGMSKEIQDSLFKVERMVTTHGTNNESGTGLGLILCLEMAIQNKGTIWVESEKGVGSTFKFNVMKSTN